MKNEINLKIQGGQTKSPAYVYFILHRKFDMFKVGKSIDIVKRVNFMGISEFNCESCIALELKTESLARNLESDFKRNLKQFNIPLNEAFHLLRTNSGRSEWFLGEAWSSLEERINEFSTTYEFRRVTVTFPKFIYTARAKSIYESECIWTKRWYKRNKDLKSSGHFHNTLQLITENSIIENVWCINQQQFNVSFFPKDSLENVTWWQGVMENLQEQSYSELTREYFMHQSVSCFENTIVITFNSCLDVRSAFDVENPYDLLMEKLFAEALAKFRLMPREILN